MYVWTGKTFLFALESPEFGHSKNTRKAAAVSLFMKQLASSLDPGPNSSGVWASHLLTCTTEMNIHRIIGGLNETVRIKL